MARLVTVLGVLDSAQMRNVMRDVSARCCTFGISLVMVLPVFSPAQSGIPSVPLSPSSQAAPTGTGATSSANPMTPLSPPAGGADANVRLGAGDLIEVSVYDVPELNTRTRVSNNGDVYLPLIDYVHVADLTIDEAEKVIERRLEQGGYVRNPHVQLFVAEYTSDGATILGEIARPGVYPVLGQGTLFTLISSAGGLTDRAGQSITITHRDQPNKPVTVTLSQNLQDHPESNVAVYAGDTVMVRRADVIYVVGDVARPSGFLMDHNGRLSVLQAIALAGGTASSAKLNGARIIRKGPTGLSEVPVPLKKLLQAKANDIPLQADDILFVPTSTKRMLGGRSAETALQLAAAATLLTIRP